MKQYTYTFIITLFTVFITFGQEFVHIKDNNFIKDGKPYHFIGTNYWYGAMIGAKNGDRARLLKELDELKAHGISNLRVLVGAEGGDQDYTVTPALQTEKGKYDEVLLDGLDFLLAEMKKRDLTAILFLNNNWEWSGGMAKYLEWNGYGVVPNPNIEPNTWPQFMNYTKQFHSCKPCQEDFEKHMQFIIGRTNPYTNLKYTDDPTIMSWEVANEPRVFTKDNEEAFTLWINSVVNQIKKLDPNHLVTTGSEGKAGSNDDIATFERTHKNPNIDYLTMHIWPKNWSWYNVEDERKTTKTSIKKTLDYIDEHIQVAKNLNKIIVLEEFGFPRDQVSFDRKDPISYRNKYYKAVFKRMKKAIKNNEPFVALNFWGYSGIGKNTPSDGKWRKGDDFNTDPPQEPQGLYSVFTTDKSTLDLIKKYNLKINK
ncbi:cellulase family glycosylhydrolase [Flavobacterium jejuense]|uniref:mannan endo-1,4-beta-mannosidase n=1 Tax=Flavobacterium jejuense TaxID=1544455 RepID=A0ABX0J0N2_9FLAO|nr:cellulase family glycosylhydrolase [Flavobacterium jejuense]NHN27776.1 cellulase family glycosylhydrolase [Flavobacterium jejuense]